MNSCFWFIPFALSRQVLFFSSLFEQIHSNITRVGWIVYVIVLLLEVQIL